LAFFAAAFLASCGEHPGSEELLRYGKAKAAYEGGAFAEAAALLEKTDFSQALVLRGKALYFSGADEEAERCLRRALKKNPQSQEAALFLARLLRDRGDDGEARRLVEGLVASNPQDIRALRLASDLAEERGDGEAAAAFLNLAADAAAETALVFLDRGRRRYLTGNNAGAIEDIAKAEALLGENSPLKRNVAALRNAISSSMASSAPSSISSSNFTSNSSSILKENSHETEN
jgi:tetratricopeptide (TPR) repeat protein